MKPETISDAIGLLSEEAVSTPAPTPVRRPWIRYVAIAACVALAVTAVLIFPGQSNLRAEAETLAEATYPEQVPYPTDWNEQDWDAWREQQTQKHNQSTGYVSDVSDFFSTTAPLLLSDPHQNQVYSPLNLYVALGTLSEVTHANSRAQILKVLGADDTAALRQKIAALWNTHYRNDGAVTSLLANSLWLDNSLPYKQAPLTALAEHYRASTYRGEMGSAALNGALQSWINEQTGGLLKEQSGKAELSDRTLLALVSTLYFRAKWTDVFDPANTAPAVFHGTTGDVTCDFMHQTTMMGYVKGNGFSAIDLYFDAEGGRMQLILPDEGISPAQLVQQGVLNKPQTFSESYIVDISLPKFDVSADLDLTDTLKRLGVTDVFDPDKADFSTVTNEPAFLAQAKHAARVSVDEEGCTAAAFTTLGVDGMGATQQRAEMNFNRPFLFVLYSNSNAPLMAGTVYQP